MTLDVSKLRRFFHYDPRTGAVTRLYAEGANTRHVGRECRTRNGCGYFSTRFGGVNVAVHRIAFALMTGSWPTGIVDHINGDKTDNRWCNLRECSKAQNNQNLTTMRGRSGFRGVHWDKRFQRWKASIKANGLRYNLGSFVSKEDAISARLKASKELHGEFAGKHTAKDHAQ